MTVFPAAVQRPAVRAQRMWRVKIRLIESSLSSFAEKRPSWIETV